MPKSRQRRKPRRTTAPRGRVYDGEKAAAKRAAEREEAEKTWAADPKLTVLVKRINRREKAGRKDQVEHALAQGRDLLVAKGRVTKIEPKGWLRWLKQNRAALGVEVRQAQNYMAFANTQYTAYSEEAWEEWQRIQGNGPPKKGTANGTGANPEGRETADPVPEANVWPVYVEPDERDDFWDKIWRVTRSRGIELHPQFDFSRIVHRMVDLLDPEAGKQLGLFTEGAADEPAA